MTTFVVTNHFISKPCVKTGIWRTPVHWILVGFLHFNTLLAVAYASPHPSFLSRSQNFRGWGIMIICRMLFLKIVVDDTCQVSQNCLWLEWSSSCLANMPAWRLLACSWYTLLLLFTFRWHFGRACKCGPASSWRSSFGTGSVQLDTWQLLWNTLWCSIIR